jgi:hypothetical protein
MKKIGILMIILIGMDMELLIGTELIRERIPDSSWEQAKYGNGYRNRYGIGYGNGYGTRYANRYENGYGTGYRNRTNTVSNMEKNMGILKLLAFKGSSLCVVPERVAVKKIKLLPFTS